MGRMMLTRARYPYPISDMIEPPFQAKGIRTYIPNCRKNNIQEVFHVYLNKFENAVIHLFLVILGNN